MDVVILIGHGGTSSETPRELVRELMQLEKRREPGTPMSEREAELDEKIRHWPRTPETDPYKFGLERIGETLRPKVAPAELRLAFNEFCAPSIEAAVAEALRKQYPEAEITYAWPFSLDATTDLLAATVQSHAPWAE